MSDRQARVRARYCLFWLAWISLKQAKFYLKGNDFSSLTEDERAAIRRGRIGFVFQSFQLLQGLTALENVMLPLELTGLSVADARQRAFDWLGRVGLGARINHRPRMLSGGEQQRVAVARAFVNEPALLFADEPTGNLDRGTGDAVSELLFELNKETGATLVLVTHDERLAARCQRMLHLEDGQLTEVAACHIASSVAGVCQWSTEPARDRLGCLCRCDDDNGSTN